MRGSFQNLSLLPLAAFAVLLMVTACAQQGPAGTERPTATIQNSVAWAVEPRMLYPVEAQLARVSSGSVTLRCIVEGSGGLTNCEVLEETPAGMGFAAAGIRAVRSARVSDAQALGADRSVTFTLGGTMSDPGTPIALTSPNDRSGDVELDCRFLNSGRLSDCRVISESPVGAGLGAAALEAVDEIPFVLPPHWRTGPRVSFTIRYTPRPQN